MAEKKRGRSEHANDESNFKEVVTQSGEPAQKKQETSKGGDTEAPKIVEDGKIYFLYRPRTGFKEAHNVSDVQRFFLVLEPQKGKVKLILIGKKKIPNKRERFFGFVQKVSNSMDELMGGMEFESHETKTVGTRSTEAARIAGEGRYSIALKKASKNTAQTHLVWKLEVPKEPGDVQKDLAIGQEGSLALSIKNPKKENPAQRNVGLASKADFGDKQKLFDGKPGGYAWIPAEDPSLLDYEHAELLFIGEDNDISATMGKKVEKHLEEEVAGDVADVGADGCSEDEEEEKLLEEMKKDLAADKHGLEVAPAAEQEWK